MKKKILLVITKSNFGGAQRYVYDLAVALPRDTYSVKVAFGGSGMLQKKLKSKHIATLPIKGLVRDIGFFQELIAFFSLIRIFRDERPDIVHLNSSKAGMLGVFAARLAGVKKIIFTAHGWAFNENRLLVTRLLFYILHYLTVLLAHQTIAVSEQTRQQIVSLPFIKKKVAVVKNGIETIPLFSKEIARETLKKLHPRLREASDEKSIWVGTVSELHPTKGLQYALKAIKEIVEHCPDVIFVIIGEGELRKKLATSIQSSQLENNVFLLGYVEDAATLLSAFDIFTLSSISEALSYTILEAGHAGLPVVASRVGGIPEIITHEELGILVPEKNSQAIARGLQTLIHNPTSRVRMGEHLKKRVDNIFTIKQMLKETIAVYEL